MKWKQWKGYSYRLIGLVLGGLRQLVGQARQAKHCDGFRRGVILEWVVPGLPVTTNKLGVASASNAAGSEEFGAGVHVRVLGGQIPLKYAGREITGQSQRQHYIGDRMKEDVQMVSAGFALPMTFLEVLQKQEMVRLASQKSLVCHTLEWLHHQCPILPGPLIQVRLAVRVPFD